MTNRKRSPRVPNAGDNELSQDQYDHLVDGFALLDSVRPWFGKLGFPFRSEGHRKRLYQLHKAKLLSDAGLFRRPHAWWSYDAPERRHIIDGEPLRAIWSEGLWFGEARREEIDGPDDPRRPIYESEKDYLTRLDLLTPAEQAEVNTEKTGFDGFTEEKKPCQTHLKLVK